LLGFLPGATAAVVVWSRAGRSDLLEMSGPTMNQMLIVKVAHCGLLGFAVAR
jgi:hypothetical protein